MVALAQRGPCTATAQNSSPPTRAATSSPPAQLRDEACTRAEQRHRAVASASPWRSLMALRVVDVEVADGQQRPSRWLVAEPPAAGSAGHLRGWAGGSPRRNGLSRHALYSCLYRPSAACSRACAFALAVTSRSVATGAARRQRFGRQPVELEPAPAAPSGTAAHSMHRTEQTLVRRGLHVGTIVGMQRDQNPLRGSNDPGGGSPTVRSRISERLEFPVGHAQRGAASCQRCSEAWLPGERHASNGVARKGGEQPVGMAGVMPVGLGDDAGLLPGRLRTHGATDPPTTGGCPTARGSFCCRGSVPATARLAAIAAPTSTAEGINSRRSPRWLCGYVKSLRNQAVSAASAA